MLTWSRGPGRPFHAGQALRHATFAGIDSVLLAASVAAVLALRLQLLATDFPINDGALFLAFVEAIARTFPLLPDTVAYNGLEIPFAYPPLAFWLAAGGVRLGLPALGLLHVAPILMNVACVLLFALLLLRTGHGRLSTAMAVLVFGTTFRSYEWLVMGGGLSRGLGSLGLLATLLALLPPGLWRDGRWAWRRIAAGGVGIGCTLLAHLEWGLLCTASALLCLALARHRPLDWLRGAIGMGCVAAVLFLPWFASVVHVHGMAPFRAASSTASWRLTAVPESGRMLLRNAAQLMPFVLLGAWLQLRRRQPFWVLFALACTLLIPRSGETPLVLAIGVLATVGLREAVTAAGRWQGRAGAAAAVVLAALGIGLAVQRAHDALRRDPHFAPLSREVRETMAWVGAQHPGARYVVLREAPWYYDGVGEWFPLLSGATSLSTLQGREWLAGGDFERRYLTLYALGEATTCQELLAALPLLGKADYAWVEGIDLQARAQALALTRERKTLAQRAANGLRRLRGLPPAGQVAPAPGALRGPGTAGGCLDAAGWREVRAQGGVRILGAPN